MSSVAHDKKNCSICEMPSLVKRSEWFCYLVYGARVIYSDYSGLLSHELSTGLPLHLAFREVTVFNQMLAYFHVKFR